MNLRAIRIILACSLSAIVVALAFYVFRQRADYGSNSEIDMTLDYESVVSSSGCDSMKILVVHSRIDSLRLIYESDKSSGNAMRFLQSFPDDFSEFLCLYGVITPGLVCRDARYSFLNEPRYGMFYEDAYTMLSSYQSALDWVPEAGAANNVRIAIDGFWQPDEVSELRRIMHDHLKQNTRVYSRVLSEASEDSAIRYWMFMLENPTESGIESSFSWAAGLMGDDSSLILPIQAARDSLIEFWGPDP